MSYLKIKEVISKKNLKNFVLFPFQLYQKNQYWVPPLIFDELKTLDNKINPAFEFCKTKYYLAYNGQKIVGRIAGILNKNYIKKWHKKYIQFAWLDFYDDYKVSQLLFKALED